MQAAEPILSQQEAMQQAQGSPHPASGAGGQKSGKPDIEEAEVEILDDEDKK